MIITIGGLLFLFFVPGFLIARLLFKDMEIIEMILLTVMLSIGFYVLLGFVLGFSELNMRLTGGLSRTWLYSLIINLILFLILLYTSKNRKKKSSKSRKKKKVK
jgi:uncharacterized membrane protein